jgi:alcohol dehydrogenase (cytochrome c)
MLIMVSLVTVPMTLLAAEWSEVTDGRLLEADKDANNWLTYYRTYNGWRYSPLSQINAQTVKRLTPKWLLSLGEAGNQQVTPLVNGDIMIVTSPLGQEINRVYAVDVTKGRVLWKHEHELAEDLSGAALIIPMSRGAALYKDKVYFGTLDARCPTLRSASRVSGRRGRATS